MTQSLSDKEFVVLFATIAKKTKHSGISTDILRTSEGRKLVDLGEETVRFMFRHNIELNAHTMCLLYEITGVNPVPNEDAGHIEKMGNAWRTWARENGYL